jgi:hypothetical protein
LLQAGRLLGPDRDRDRAAGEGGRFGREIARETDYDRVGGDFGAQRVSGGGETKSAGQFVTDE